MNSNADNENTPLTITVPSSRTKAKAASKNDDKDFSLFENEKQVLREADSMIEKLENVASGVQDLATAYRRGFREQQRMVRLSDRMQLELQQANRQLAEQAENLQRLNTALEEEVLARTRLATELERIVHHDSLTGAYSRSYLLELAAREKVRAVRSNKPLTCLLMDVDHFKQVNDTYGHATGDLVLKSFVETCQHALREVDIFGRLGGEEFVAFLPDAGLDAAGEVAERVRANIAKMDVKHKGKHINITVSIGVSSMSDVAASVEQMLSIADRRLYAAKHNGRNKVVLKD